MNLSNLFLNKNEKELSKINFEIVRKIKEIEDQIEKKYNFIEINYNY